MPDDCGISVVANPAAARSAFRVQSHYFIAADYGPVDAVEKVSELSRHARGVPVWAALRRLGRTGVIDLVKRLVKRLVERLATQARTLTAGLSKLPGVEVLNDVVLMQMSLTFGDDENTRPVAQNLIAEAAVWMSGSHWHHRGILRISVCNWSIDAANAPVVIDAVHRALAR